MAPDRTPPTVTTHTTSTGTLVVLTLPSSRQQAKRVLMMTTMEALALARLLTHAGMGGAGEGRPRA